MTALVRLLLVFLIIYSVQWAGAQDTTIHPLGQWVNEDRSRLEIDSYDPESGRIGGTYYSSTGTDGHGYPLIGWYNVNSGKGKNHSPVISFSVHWGKIGSITSWTGYLYEEEGQVVMYTLWHLVRADETYSWERLLTRSSTFVLLR